MPIPLRVLDRGGLLPADLAEHVWKRTQDLSRHHGRIRQCRVNVDGPGQHSLPDRLRIRIYLTVEDSEIAITHQGGADLHIAIRAAFDAAERRLENRSRIRSRSSKTPKGSVKRIS